MWCKPSLLTLSLSSLLLLLSLGCGGEKRLVLFHTNDEHSHIFAHGPEYDDFAQTPGAGVLSGSAARRATVLMNERAAVATAGLDSLTLSAGDETQGTLAHVAMASTAPDFVLLKRLGYDVMCPGNHEFDQGPKAFADGIKAAMARGGMPQIVSTNIKLNGQPDLTALYGDGTSSLPIKKYHVITTASGIKVGFVGVMGAEAAYYAPLKVPVTFSGTLAEESNFPAVYPKVAADIQPTVDVLRNVERVDVVVAVSHGGVHLTDPTLGDDYQLAKNTTGIDLIVGGHSHTPLQAPQLVNDKEGRPVAIVQAGSYGEWVGRVELVVKGGRATVDMDATKTKLIKVDSTIAPQSALVADVIMGMIMDLETAKRYAGGTKSFLEDALSRVEQVAVTDDPGMSGDLWWRVMATSAFTVQGLTLPGENNVLNMATDSMLAMADELGLPAIAAVQALGSTRADIKPSAMGGKLTFGDLFRVYPLGTNPLDGSIGYPLCHFYIFSAALRAAMELSVSRGYANDSFFLSPSGMRVEFDTSLPAFDFVTPGVDGRAVDPTYGRVNKIFLRNATGPASYDTHPTVFYDRIANPSPSTGFTANPSVLVPVVTSLYVASFAQAAGVQLFTANATRDRDDNPTRHIIRRNGVAVTEWEAFIRYVYSFKAGGLPANYNKATPTGAVPRRMICTGPLCN